MSRLRGNTNREFTVVIYEADYKELCSWVLKKPDIETGGDLFGLWADKSTAVVQLVLGPGKNCRRTSVSFYQDVDYLKRVGSYLTEKEGLCHIGEWHSHHTLGLARPSGGDENTVWSNMPSYHLKRFVIFIANISSSPEKVAKVGCFLFELDDKNGSQRPVLQGKFRILRDKSPLHCKGMVDRGLSRGRESTNSPEELQKLYIKRGNELEICPTAHKVLPETLKRKGGGEKKHSLSPNLKQMRTERGEAVSSVGYKAERAEKKTLRSQRGKLFEPEDTERLAKKLQEQKLDDNVEHVEAARSLACEKSSTVICTDPGKSLDEDFNMGDEEMPRDENPSAVQEHGEDKETEGQEQDKKAQGRSNQSEVHSESAKSGDTDYNKDEQLMEDEPSAAAAVQTSNQDKEAQEERSKGDQVHLKSTKSGDTDHKNKDERLMKEGPPSVADAVQANGQDEEAQEGRSKENQVHLESTKAGDTDQKKKDERLMKDEGPPSAPDAIQTSGQDEEAEEERSKETEVHLESEKSGDIDRKKDEQLTKDKEPPSAAVRTSAQEEAAQEERSKQTESHLELAKGGDADHETTGSKDEGSYSSANTVEIRGQGQDRGTPAESKATKDTKVRTQAHPTSGERTKQKTPGEVKSTNPSKKVSTSTVKTQGKPGTQQTVRRKASGASGDKKGPNAATKQVDTAKKGAIPQRGQKASTVPQTTKKTGPGAAAVTQQGSTRQRQASRTAQTKKTTTSKKTNQSDKASTRSRTTK